MARIYQRERMWYLDFSAGGKRIRRKVGPPRRSQSLPSRALPPFVVPLNM